MSRTDLISALMNAPQPAAKKPHALKDANAVEQQDAGFAAHIQENPPPAAQPPAPPHAHAHACRSRDDRDNRDTADNSPADSAADAPPADDTNDVAQADDAAGQNEDKSSADGDVVASLAATLLTPQITAQVDSSTQSPAADVSAAPVFTPDAAAAANLQSPLLGLAVATSESPAPTAALSTPDSLAAPAAVLAHAPAQVSTAPGPALIPDDAQNGDAQNADAAADPFALNIGQDAGAELVAKLQPSKADAKIATATDTKIADPATATTSAAATQKPAEGVAANNNATPQDAAADKTAAVAANADKPAAKQDAPAPANVQAAAKIDIPAPAPAAHQPAIALTAAQHNAPAQTINLPQVAKEATIGIARVPFEITVAAHRGEKEFEIRLDPPDLGRVDVSMSVDKHGRVNTHLVVERSETLDQLRRDAPNLERALQNSGLKTDSGSLQFSLRDQNAQNFSARDEGTSRRGVLDIDMNATTVLAQPYMASLGAGRGAGIDLHV